MNSTIMRMLATAHTNELIQARRAASARDRLINPVRRPRRRPQA